MLIDTLLWLAAILASLAIVLAASDLIGYMKAKAVIQVLTESFPGLRALGVEILLLTVAYIPALLSLAVLQDLKAAVPGLAIISDWTGVEILLAALVPLIIFGVVHLRDRTKRGRAHSEDK